MAVMGRTSHAPLFAFDFVDRVWQITNPTMEIVGGTQEDNRARNVFQADIVAKCFAKQVAVVVSIADATARRRGRFDSWVHGCHHRQLAAHRVAVDTKSLSIDFGLLLKERQCAPRSDCTQNQPLFRGDSTVSIVQTAGFALGKAFFGFRPGAW